MNAEDKQINDDDKVQQLLSLQNRKQIVPNVDLNRAETFGGIYSRLSKEEIFVEYVNFLRTFPDLLDTEKVKLVKIVKDELCIDKIVQDINTCNFDRLVDTHQSSYLIEHLSIKLGFSLRILCPPVKSCILCEKTLTLNNKATQVMVHSVTGPQLFSKYSYRCCNCKLVKKAKVNKTAKDNAQDIYYHSDQYGNLKNGWMFYKKNHPPFVKESNEVYFTSTMIKSYVNNLCHAWMSMEGQAEAFNQTWLNSDEVFLVKLFLANNPKVGKHFDQKMKVTNAEEDLDFPHNENSNESEGKKIFSGMAEMHRKSLSQVNTISTCNSPIIIMVKFNLKSR